MKDGAVTLRSHYRAGDWGWVVERHGWLYAQEQGWGSHFEALVCRLVGEFAQKCDPNRDRFWIAEQEGRRIGCVFLSAEDERTGRLRFFLVEPDARGFGVGRRLVDACLAHARAIGCRRVILSTQSVLEPARRLYQAAGFRLVSAALDPDFATEVERWEIDLN